MDALVETLYQSEMLKVSSFLCRCNECGYSGIEYQQNFSICYIQQGSFLFQVFDGELECFNGRFLLNKPGFTHRVKHYHTMPDQCFIISFPPEFYERMVDAYPSALNGFLKNKDSHSLTLGAIVDAEYMVFRLKTILHKKKTEGLEIEGIVLDLIEVLFGKSHSIIKTSIPDKHRQYYLPAIEKTRTHIQEQFAEQITMDGLARVSNMSAFHFNRVFRQINGITPYQYLLAFRMNHAGFLLKSTEEPISSVGWLSGFNGPDHFSYAFKVSTGFSPQSYRRKYLAGIPK